MARHDSTWQWRRVWWPGTLSADTAHALIERLAADRHLGHMAWETRSTNGQVTHLVATTPGHTRAANHTLSSLISGVRIDASAARRDSVITMAGRVVAPRV